MLGRCRLNGVREAPPIPPSQLRREVCDGSVDHDQGKAVEQRDTERNVLRTETGQDLGPVIAET